MDDRYYQERGTIKVLYILQRVLAILAVVMMFFPNMNPARVCEKIKDNISLFTAAVSYYGLTDELVRAFNKGWADESTFIMLYISAIMAVIGILLMTAGGCMSVGNLKLRHFGILFSLAGGIVTAASMLGMISSYNTLNELATANKIAPIYPKATIFYIVVGIAVAVFAVLLKVMLPRAERGASFDMESKYKLFLLFLPFAVLAFIFSYLPLYGWRYAFFNYQSGDVLSKDNFVGFYWFQELFKNEATRMDVVRVLRNTLAMSGINLITSWLPMMFAIFLCEIKSIRVRRFIQTFTTIPNFISWVLVYAIALSIFSTEGFINTLSINLGLIDKGHNYLMDTSYTWVKMWLWGTWKGIGWSAIIYIAGISGIDQQLYEAATVDGAGRFQKMWHVTVPGLMPTFFVLLLMAIAGILSNGMDQYLVFENSNNTKMIEVLDLYVYHLGLGNGSIPLSTVVGMCKSIISVILLFGANAFSKKVRGESIV